MLLDLACVDGDASSSVVVDGHGVRLTLQLIVFRSRARPRRIRDLKEQEVCVRRTNARSRTQARFEDSLRGQRSRLGSCERRRLAARATAAAATEHRSRPYLAKSVGRLLRRWPARPRLATIISDCGSAAKLTWAASQGNLGSAIGISRSHADSAKSHACYRSARRPRNARRERRAPSKTIRGDRGKGSFGEFLDAGAVY